MSTSRTPIRRKLTAMVLLASGTALFLTCIGLFITEWLTYRSNTEQQLRTLGEIVATNSTAALAFNDAEAAAEILSALKAEPYVRAAALYRTDSGLFATYPLGSTDSLPSRPGMDGYEFERGYLAGSQAVHVDNRRVGTLYLRFDMSAVYGQLARYALVAMLVLVVSLLAAYTLSGSLQRQISQPILSLAETAEAVSRRRDYSVRAPRLGHDELGLLTDAFNQMLTQIQSQHHALEVSETRVRAVLDSALSAVVVIDAGGRIMEWNVRAETMFGWLRPDVIGVDLAEFIIPVRYREAHRKGMKRLSETGQGPILNRLIEMPALRRDGTEFPVEICVSPLPLPSGNDTTFCGFLTDISERKLAESKVQAQLLRLDLLNRITRAIGERQDPPSIFRVLLRNLEDNLSIDYCCVLLCDSNRESLTVSSLGSTSAALTDQLQLHSGTQIPIDQNGLSRCLRGQLVYEPDIVDAEFPFTQRLSGAGLRALVIAPLLAESHVFGALVAARRKPGSFSSSECEFLRQASEHVALSSHQARLYVALQQAYDDLRQSQQAVMQQERLRALGQMASGVAHDINNAISPISLYTESLLEREPNLSDRARTYLTTIQRSIEDVAATVGRMREFYRPREPQLSLVRVNVNNLIRQVIDMTQARWSDLPQEKGVVVSMQTDLSEESPALLGIESEIRDALTNLIFNAVDAMPNGGRLTLRTRATDAPSRTSTVVEVSDSGIGMTEETKRRCLEPFYTTKGERGTGLGLAMVYGMTQRHGADMEIESEEGQGTTVRMIFPAPSSTTEAAVRLPPSVGSRRLRILVIDDDPILVETLREILEADGHVVAAADGGQRGIDLFSSAHGAGEPFSIVITDLGMPYVDGRQVAAAIKSASPQVPIILLTGWGQRLLADNDVPPYVDRVLNKPPTLSELREAVLGLTATTAEFLRS